MQPLCIHCAGRFLFHTCGIRTLFIYFTNHVGEQRNFCKQKCDVPLLVCLSNSTLSAQRSAYFFKTLYGTTFPHTARLHKFMNNQTLPLRAGCRGRQPLHQNSTTAKSLRSVLSFTSYLSTTLFSFANSSFLTSPCAFCPQFLLN